MIIYQLINLFIYLFVRSFIHSFHFISAVMLLAAVLVLNDQLISGMSMGDTAKLGYVATVFAFLSAAVYTTAAVLVIKHALASAKTSQSPPTNQKAEITEMALESNKEKI